MAAELWFHPLRAGGPGDPAVLGGKGAALVRMSEAGVKTAPGVAVEVGAYRAFVEGAGLADELAELARGFEAAGKTELRELRRRLLEAPLPDGFESALASISAPWFEQGRVIVRSSATVEDSASHSYAGIFESIVVEAPEELAGTVRRVWASVVKPRALSYYQSSGLRGVPAMGLIVQPFLEATRSGVMFTAFAHEGREDLLLEHVEGGCEKLVSGATNPDRLWLRREADLSWVDVPADTGALGAELVRELVEAASVLEEHFGGPQDVEWCVTGRGLTVLQSRPVTRGGGAEASRAPASTPLLTGVAASRGQADGPAHLVFNIEDAESLQAGSVLVTAMTNPDMVPAMRNSHAVVTDVGGMICHAAIVSRELGIPCIVGTETATREIPAKEWITVDGTAGAVYRGRLEAAFEEGEEPLTWSWVWEQWREHEGSVPVVSSLEALAASPASVRRCAFTPEVELLLGPTLGAIPWFRLPEEERRAAWETLLDRIAACKGDSQLQIELLVSDSSCLEAREAAPDGPGTQGSTGPSGQESAAATLPPGPPPPARMLFRERRHELQIPGLDELARERGLKLVTYAAGDTGGIVTKGAGKARGEEAGVYLRSAVARGALEPTERRALYVPLAQVLWTARRGIDARRAEPGGGVFGRMPDSRALPMPDATRRAAYRRLVPVLDEVRREAPPVERTEYEWLDVRPEVAITPWLKSLVLPAMESIPRALHLDGLPPFHVQWRRCRFHFRKDTFLQTWMRLQQATWDERFLDRMLQETRRSYERLEEAARRIPVDPPKLRELRAAQAERAFLPWWHAFVDFFGVSFFIQAQGDDCVYPGLTELLRPQLRALSELPVQASWPDLSAFTAPAEPVLTAEYMADLQRLAGALRRHGCRTREEARECARRRPEVSQALGRHLKSWYWMRERDPYYPPYDTEDVVLGKALALREAPEPDYAKHRAEGRRAASFHFDLAESGEDADRLLYASAYGRELTLDRENHHVVWLKTSYPMRRLCLEWERRLAEVAELVSGDVFFFEAPELLGAVRSLPDPPAKELLERVKNRRLGYEHEMKLKRGEQSGAQPRDEPDYY